MNTNTARIAKYVAYRRVSTQHQERSGLGLEAQQAAIEAFVASQGGDVSAIEWFVDVESGKNDDRPEFQKAIAKVRRTRRAVLLVAKQDRMTRRAATSCQLIDEGLFIDVSSPFASPLEQKLKAVIDEEEARRISERTKAALKAAKARGVKLGTPENLTVDARKAGAEAVRNQAIDAYAKTIAEIVALRDSGLSYKAISDALNAKGLVTRTGAEFKPMTVHRILEREATCV